MKPPPGYRIDGARVSGDWVSQSKHPDGRPVTENDLFQWRHAGLIQTKEIRDGNMVVVYAKKVK